MTLSQICLKAANRFKFQGGEGENRQTYMHIHNPQSYNLMFLGISKTKTFLVFKKSKDEKNSPVWKQITYVDIFYMKLR